MNEDLDYLKKQHIKNYKNMALQMILNNNNSLFDEDITSLIKKPPLDSMDLIKTKLISISKKEKIILNTDEYNKRIDNYREDMIKICNKNKEIRLKYYNDIVNSFKFNNNNKDVIKILKKDTNDLNKEIRRSFKEGIIKSINNNFDKNFNSLFNDIDNKNMDDVYKKVFKYLNSTYVKQLLENIDIKILVKDTILINSFKEEGEKYLYTLNNSRLFMN